MAGRLISKNTFVSYDAKFWHILRVAYKMGFLSTFVKPITTKEAYKERLTLE